MSEEQQAQSVEIKVEEQAKVDVQVEKQVELASDTLIHADLSANLDADESKTTEPYLAAKFASLIAFDLVELSEAELLQRAGTVAMYDVDPKQWGRHFWNAFHIIAYAYPETPDESTQLAAFLFFDSLRKLLPCSKCRGNYVQNWLDFDIRKHLHTRTALIEWLIMLHDAVNEETGKGPLDYALLINRLTGIEDAVVVTVASPAPSIAFESAKTSEAKTPAKPSPRRSHSVEPKPSASTKKQLQTFPLPKKAAIKTAKKKEASGVRASTFARKVQVKPPKPCPSCSGKMTLTPSIF